MVTLFRKYLAYATSYIPFNLSEYCIYILKLNHILIRPFFYLNFEEEIHVFLFVY